MDKPHILYHFSENPDIVRFVPMDAQNRTDLPPVVWAIDEGHSINYLFPRDCPRVIYERSSGLTAQDETEFFGLSAAQKIIMVESRWLDRIREAALYCYSLPADTFELLDEIAGYYVSSQTVTPLRVERVPDLLGEIIRLGAELRFTPSLYPARDAILRSSLKKFSVIRFRNAL